MARIIKGPNHPSPDLDKIKRLIFRLSAAAVSEPATREELGTALATLLVVHGRSTGLDLVEVQRLLGAAYGLADEHGVGVADE